MPVSSSHWLRRSLVASTFAFAAGNAFSAPEWPLSNGKAFSGEATEINGALAYFRTSAYTGKWLPIGALSDADCVRFHNENKKRPAPAATWDKAKGRITEELINALSVLKDGKPVPLNFSALPEPAFVIVAFASSGDGDSWQLLGRLPAFYRRLERVYPGKVAMVYFGLRHKESDHLNMAKTMGVPWYLANFDDERHMSTIASFAPAEGPRLIAFTRDGVPLIAAADTSFEALARFADQFSEFLALSDPDNPKTWAQRLHYLNPTRAADSANVTLPPELVVNPLRSDALLKAGIQQLDATIEVGPSGAPSKVTLLPSSVYPEKLTASLNDILTKGLYFAPGISHGNPVVATYPFHFVPRMEDETAHADRAWLNGDARQTLPVPSWLVLRPIQVEERDFSEVQSVDKEGVVTMNAVQVSSATVSKKAQLSAFHTDWFAAAGAASVQPVEGQSQTIDGVTLKWEKIASPDGYVDFVKGVGSHDHSIGYAWTEVESPADTDAWLAIGSDDGVRFWVNGKVVIDKWTRRPSVIDDDVVSVRLHKGKNQLLIKIQNVTGDWSFLSRIKIR